MLYFYPRLFRRDFRLICSYGCGYRVNYASGYVGRRLSAEVFIGHHCNRRILGIIVPPSIPMVIYGMAAGASVSEVFMGGFLPGFMLAGGMSIYSVIWAMRNKDIIKSHKFSLKMYGLLLRAQFLR